MALSEVRRATSRSCSTWRLSQNSGDVRKQRASRSAVSAVTARVPFAIAVIRVRRHAERFREPVGAEAERHHELLAQDFAGRHRREEFLADPSPLSLSPVRRLMVVHNFHIVRSIIAPNGSRCAIDR